MNKENTPIEAEYVACDICMNEVPKSEAVIPEASDYVAHFCGLDCYEKWKNQNQKTKDSSSS